MQAFIDESLDNVLPKFRQCAKYFKDFTLLFCTLLKILNSAKENGTVQKTMC